MDVGNWAIKFKVHSKPRISSKVINGTQCWFSTSSVLWFILKYICI